MFRKFCVELLQLVPLLFQQLLLLLQLLPLLLQAPSLLLLPQKGL